MSPDDLQAQWDAWAERVKDDPELKATGRRIARALIGGSDVSAGKHEGGRT